VQYSPSCANKAHGAGVIAVYVCRYGGEHKAPELQKEVVYGLTELHREAVK